MKRQRTISVLAALGLCVAGAGCATKVAGSGGDLLFASETGSVENVQALIDSGVDANFANADGWTPLLAATQAGHQPVVELLFDKGPARRQREKQDGLHATDGRHRITKPGRRRGLACEGRRCRDCGGGWLDRADVGADTGDATVVKMLLDHGADANAVTTDGWTPLMSAADKGRADAARRLLAKGARVNATNHENKTALAFATHNQHAELIALLSGR